MIVTRHKARVSSTVALLLATLLMAPNHALANTLTTSSPAAGAVLGVAPNAVSVTGTTTLADQGSTISVTDPTGLQVDDGSVTITDTTAVIGLKPLIAAGVYTVTYSLVSATDAPLTGSYTFLFNAPAAVASATPTPTQSVTVVPASKGTHTADIFVIILMLFALLVGLFLLWYARLLLRERKANKRKSRSKAAARKPKTDKEDRQ